MVISKFKTIMVPTGAAFLAALSLVTLYLGVLSVAKSPPEALNLFWQNRLMLLPIALGFALQVGLYVFLRRGLHHPVAIPSGMVTTTTGGGTSATAMIACCAPALVNALPLLGFTALTTFLAKWQMPFIVTSILVNAIGITVMITNLLRSRRRPTHII
jgi:Cu+-exporting ATPase